MGRCAVCVFPLMASVIIASVGRWPGAYLCNGFKKRVIRVHICNKHTTKTIAITTSIARMRKSKEHVDFEVASDVSSSFTDRANWYRNSAHVPPAVTVILQFVCD